MFLSVARLKIASEDPPRIIRREELPEDYQPYWHTTTALDQVRQQGLRSRTERQTEQQALGGGSPDNVSLTNDQAVAENISGWIKDNIAIANIVKTGDREAACNKAEQITYQIAEESGVADQWSSIIEKARKNISGSYLSIKGDYAGTTPFILAIRGYSKRASKDLAEDFNIPSFGIFHHIKVSDLPEGCIPIRPFQNANGEEITPEVLCPEQYSAKDRYSDPNRIPNTYYDLIRTFIESAGGKMGPLGWEMHPQNFWDLDPNQVGVVDILTQGEPDRNTGALGEWAGLPEKTRVIVD